MNYSVDQASWFKVNLTDCWIECPGQCWDNHMYVFYCYLKTMAHVRVHTPLLCLPINADPNKWESCDSYMTYLFGIVSIIFLMAILVFLYLVYVKGTI